MAEKQSCDESFPNSFRDSYDVFLSFKSEDAGKKFTDHLSAALSQAGYRTFRGGDEETEREEDINLELPKAIQEAKITIIVFSQNYATSSWCLDQLVTILERKMKFACTILPIFYHVDPSNLRKHKGSIGEALGRHEEYFKYERHGNEKDQWEDKLKKWKDALSQAADLAGMVLENQHESSFIRKIINVISTRLSRPALYIASCTIGIHRRARPINSWIQDGSTNNNIGILLVCGIGGIGKTTLAKFVYNLNFGYFESSCFLANIRETSKLPNGLITLQKQLLSSLLKHEKAKISCVDEGIIKIRNALCNRRVLLVLDDVDEPDLVEAIFDMKDWFGFGSKIIVTTRHKSLLRPQLGHEVHEVEILYTSEANELFNWHAFGKTNPSEGYKEYSEEVIEWCRGLPLALQVIGSSLAGKSKDVWKSAIEKLRDIPTNKIVDKLRLSYELLEDDHDQKLFLHLSCFFVGMKKDFVVRILDKCDFYTLVGIQNLIDRSLVTIEYVNEITMHQLVRDMGRDVVRREAPMDPGKRSRLWHHPDSYNVLSRKMGTEAVQGIVLDMRMIKKENLSPLLPVRQNTVGFFTWSTKGSSSLQDLRTDAFEKMHKLRFLKFNKVQVNGNYKKFPKGLRWLCWSGYPEESIPNEFPMASVVSIDMRYSSLKQLWKGYKLLQFLEILDLGHSYELITTPDFSGIPNLERLILEHCTKLISIHETIGCLQNLIHLNLKDCQKLKSLPVGICELKCLETLNISGCSNIEYLPTELDKLTSLKELYADGIGINRATISANELGVQTWYGSLWAWAWKDGVYTKIQDIHFPRSLHVLNIAKCNLSPDAFGKVDLGILNSLDWLDLGGNPISNLPDSIKNLTRLKTLNIAYCTKIKNLEGLPSNISDLNADGCISLEKVSSCAKGHPVEGYINCINLVEVEGVFKLEPLENANPQVLNNMGISTLEHIKGNMVSLVFGRAYNAGRVRHEYPRFVQDDITSLFSLSPKKFPPQILYHRGVFSTFLPGESVPSWFSYKFTDAADVYCTLPNVDSHRVISGLSICFVYTCPEAYTNVGLYDGPAIWIRNQTKDLNYALYPAWFGLPEDEISGMMWLSYWKVQSLFEQGDVIEVMGSPQFAAFKEIGVKIFYLNQQTQNSDSNVSKSNDPYEDILRNYFSDEERTFYICT